ncbi:MAG: tetratricopeptide repeat protein [Deltaproteobacteria bacterium]|nr:MAG: tetratricopeptide repeat protein [Deltaproteobacteria bacterium]
MVGVAALRGVLAALLCALLGCSAIEGARLYREGTEALERGDAESAVRALELAADRAPEASEVQNHLGLAYLASGRRDDAVRAFERAIALDCDNAAARHNLAAAHGEPTR